MKGKEIIELLQESPEFAEAEIYFSLWTAKGEKKIRTSRPLGLLQIEKGSKNGKYLRISWSDDCNAHRLWEKDGVIEE